MLPHVTLKTDPKVNRRGIHNCTSLLWAAGKGSIGLVHLLLRWLCFALMLGRRLIILTKLTTSTEMNKIFTQARGKSGRWGQVRDNSSNLGVQVTSTNALNDFFGLTMLFLMQGRPH